MKEQLTCEYNRPRWYSRSTEYIPCGRPAKYVLIINKNRFTGKVYYCEECVKKIKIIFKNLSLSNK